MEQPDGIEHRLPNLTVAEYDREETKAVATAPIRVIEAFQPVQFAQVGVPHRIRQDTELFKYMQIHSLAFEPYFSNLLGGLTPDEFDLQRRVATLVCDFSEFKFGKKAIPRGDVLSSLNVFRHIQFLFGPARPRVFEIGPGGGYLGAMLMLAGYSYAATDVSQAFYLYQNHLWNYISGGKVLELALGVDEEGPWSAPSAGEAVHVPWWQFARLTPDEAPGFDIITCNHAIRELQPDSLALTLRMAREFLAGEDTPKAFIFEGWGSGRVNSDVNVTECFYDLGFVMVHNDPLISVFVPKGNPWADGGLELPKIDKSLTSRSKALLRRMVGGSPPLRKAGYAPLRFNSPQNPASRAILEGRKETKGTATVSIDDVIRFHTELLGHEDHSSPDERFLNIGRGS